ncbi:endopeptidase La [Gammaproteobacteria bacterium]|nr:endopeptidase La [Gammaproteobacteria bacterium]
MATIQKSNIPVVTLKDMVVFPQGVQPLFIGTPKSIKALDVASSFENSAGKKEILLLAKRKSTKQNPQAKDLFEIGTVATVLQLIRLPDETVKILVEGNLRARVLKLSDNQKYLSADIQLLETIPLSADLSRELRKDLLDVFEAYASKNKKIPSEVSGSLSGIDDLSRLIDTIASQLSLTIQIKQRVLETVDEQDRYDYLRGILMEQVELLSVDKKVRGRVKRQMEKSQKEYYLNEQMKAIQKELGDIAEAPDEIEELGKRLANSGMPKSSRKKTESEISKLKQMSPMSAEATVVRSYIDWMLSVPWKKKSKISSDIVAAKEILEHDHHGLDDVKDRIIEYLAVQKRVDKLKGPVLCLVGPPGVGKTSLGESIARATNRKFVRMALGGVRDEAEIRGHRRTYIGSMPGKIVQKLAKVGLKNPLFLLDEVDKMGLDHRGDPASALLEVLDPEQNDTFNDNYLEVDYDLSDVMFICTSNSMNIPLPLLDRMEIIKIPGYTEEEKKNIASRFLLPKQLTNNGLSEKELQISDKSILDLIRFYTREAGVRGLEKEIAKICRKVVKKAALAKERRVSLTKIVPRDLDKYLGIKKFNFGEADSKDEVGQVTGLAVTSVGGDLLTIEVAAVPGKGSHNRTGSLGDVMKESVQAATTVVRSRAEALNIEEGFHEKLDLHVHIPEGATPKDGPSAGIGICTAMISAITGIPARGSVAMTGEITLRGQVLAIGGLKEKLLAAHRGSIKTVIIPEANKRDLKEIPSKILKELEVIPINWIDELLDIALTKNPLTFGADAKNNLGEGTDQNLKIDERQGISAH